MIRAWLAIALLAVSWLIGLSYYHQATWLGRAERGLLGMGDVPGAAFVGWPVVVAAAVLLLVGSVRRTAGRTVSVVAAVLILPAVWLAPWPYKAVPVLLLAGLLLEVPRFPRRWPRALGAAAVTAGAVLLGQALAMEAYAAVTARSHELPWPLPSLLGWLGGLLGAEVAVDGSRLAVWTMREVHDLGATWELLVDPASLCFLVGGAVLVGLRAWSRRVPWRDALRALAGLVVPVVVWLPVRAGLQIALFHHRALITDYDAKLDLMGQLWSPWVHLLLLVPPLVLAWRFARLPRREPEAVGTRAVAWWRPPVAAGLAGLGVVLVVLGQFWEPLSFRPRGRVLVDEHHSDWESTERPYDTEWYGHDSGYNYACIYDYLTRFYDMGRLDEPITDEVLADCRVLILKCPDAAPYAPEEVETIERFVEKGGGLLLVGEHTDVFGTGRHLNAVGRRFGVAFRYDCCFGIDSFFDDRFPPPLLPHPIVQHMPPFDFAVSCSVAPPLAGGRSAMVGTGLKNLGADYHASNFYPQAEDRAEMRYGAFTQLWAARHGRGRVVAFGDSTVFSNFSTFEPGKPQLMLGMIEWAARCDLVFDPRLPLAVAGLLCLGGAVWLGRRWPAGWVVVVAAGLGAWGLAGGVVRVANRDSVPLPQPVRPLTRVTIDRTVSDCHLPKSGFIAGEDGEFGIFERWILRLGYFTSRRAGTALFDGDLAVFFYPNLDVEDDFREALVAYVEGGGHALVLDGPGNERSKANSLLWPFGLSLDHGRRGKGALAVPEGWPSVPVESAAAVEGGTALARVGGVPVAATARHGEGTVTAVGFGSRFADSNMGVTGDVEPGPDLRKVFDLQFTLLRAIVEGKLPTLAEEAAGP
ncbi:MAG: hypothetical protein ACOC8D_00485 [bacterium]